LRTEASRVGVDAGLLKDNLNVRLIEQAVGTTEEDKCRTGEPTLRQQPLTLSSAEAEYTGGELQAGTRQQTASVRRHVRLSGID
jgi:hypothetical protein